MNKTYPAALIFFGICCQMFPLQAVHAHTDIERIYEKYCAGCHGKKMQGGLAESLLDDNWNVGNSDDEIALAIATGVPGTSMPGWKHLLSTGEIRALVILIREQKYASRKTPKTSTSAAGIFKSREHNFTMSIFARGTDKLWGLDFLPDGDLLATQHNGVLWRFKKDKRYKIRGTPKVWHRRQGGLMDVAVNMANKNNPWVYLSYSERSANKAIAGRAVGSTTIVRGKIEKDRWTKEEIIFQTPEENRLSQGRHFGSRIVFQDDYVFFSIGDEGYPKEAQNLSTQSGKIHRLYADGRVPEDNPFFQVAGAQKSIWTYGNRNPQGLDFHPLTGKLWEAEHGPRGGDEINIIEHGKNYGWPIVTHGMNYDGTPMTDKTSAPGIESPKLFWVPSIAVCGIEFYEGEKFPHWKHNLFVGGLKSEELRRLVIENNTVKTDEVVLKGLGRVRDIANGPDGSIYVIINGDEYKIVRISPVE